MSERYEKRNSKKSAKSIVVLLITIICLGIMIYSGYNIFVWWQENQKNKELMGKIEQEVNIYENKNVNDIEKYNIDFKELKNTNSDIVGWLKVWGTEVEFPVVKTDNNEFYLTHSLDKSYNTSGWIFADCNNKLDGTDKNIVIYGHNRRDDSMFGTLKNILNKEWYENKNNLFIPFIKENKSDIYEVFSVYKIEKENYYITTDFENDLEFKKYIDTVKSRSVKDFNVDVSTKDELLTLSTCANNNKYRVVLHAKKIEQ